MADAFYPFVGEGPTDIAGDGGIAARAAMPATATTTSTNGQHPGFAQPDGDYPEAARPGMAPSELTQPGAALPELTQPGTPQPTGAQGTAVNTAARHGELPKLHDVVDNPARIAVFDDPAAAPRVVVVQPTDVRSFLEEITATVTKLAKEQGGRISFTVIREVVENLVHAYFIEPTISILDDGNTIRFSDQGPGIREKDKALEYGTTSATEEMKRYIRGVGSGLPYAQQYMRDHGGDLTIEDNISAGTIVTISMPGERPSMQAAGTPTGSGLAGQPSSIDAQTAAAMQLGAMMPQPTAPQSASTSAQAAGMQPGMAPIPQGAQAGGYPQQGYTAQYAWSYQQNPYGQQGYPLPVGYQPAPGYPQMQPAQGASMMPAQQAGYPQMAPAATAAAGIGAAGTAGMGVLPAGSPATGPDAAAQQAASAGQTWTPDVSLTERGREAMLYLTEHESVGPTELAKLCGSSLSTWTRELKRLEDQGLVRRNGQKRFLTDAGRAVASSL